MSVLKNSPDIFLNQPFKDLKKILKKKEVEPAVKKERLKNDEELFMESMKEVREISEYREMPVYQKQSVYPCRGNVDDNDTLKALEEIIDGKRPVHLPDTPEYVEWIDRDYRDSLVTYLHEGRYSIQDCLDLHGATLAEAKEEVENFIKASIRNGYKCIKIIHGRGLRSPNAPVLKAAVVKWLLSSFRKYVAAFVTARQCDGGLGALYVLLK